MAYVTTAEVKTYLGVGDAGDDTLIGDLIDHAQKMIEQFTDHIFESTSTSTRNFDAVRDVDGRTLKLDQHLAAITTVTNGDGATIASGNYVTEPRNETPYTAIRLKGSANVAWEPDSNGDPEDAIAIEGNWAYSTSPPADITYYTKRLTAYLYRLKDAQVFEVTASVDLGETEVQAGIPDDIKEGLAMYIKKPMPPIPRNKRLVRTA